MTTRRALATFLVLLVVPTAPASAQATEPRPGPDAPRVSATLGNLTRVETWRFFEPLAPEVEPDYTFWGNRSDLLLEAAGPGVDLEGGFSYVLVEELPTRAIGPGGLGTGAFYFAASGQPFSYQVFLTSLSARIHDRQRRRSLALGRMAYTSGAESARVPGAAVPGAVLGAQGAVPGAALRDVRRLAIEGRLIGTFDWSLYQRRFDGVRADWREGRRYAGGSAFLVSQGGYEESANLTMDRLFVSSAYAGRHHGEEAESQVFGVLYRDRREVDIRPDNSQVPVSAADVTVGALGASHVAARPWRTGIFDYAAWGAWQGGDWYGQPHRAFAGMLQGGFRWTAAPWAPWLRAGWSHASGDADGSDHRHGTFFPMLQETRTWAQSMVYAHANLRDLFVQVQAAPHSRAALRVDLHRLDLANAADRWYQGSGATARDGRFFGYSSRPSGGARALGTVLEASGDVRLSRVWSVNAYASRMWGGPVVRGVFAGDRLFYWYVENVLRLRVGS